ncbi:hypothetical protein NP493_2g18025 [Ridgeia piscesae]|uniref:Replication termination factor 2 n=1 Tax=Ridgeia piscesae TaxID=27915 RepID=A0AAD9ULU9_RIDPI|nr:hypothetical protein NP493_2g18025 [Ridgeia piscesae]
MGCDGGTIPTRDELVRLKKKPEKKDRDAELGAKWKHCAITQEPLQQPIVACELGRLYNKESVLEMLLDKSKFECAQSFDHIRGLKDIKELQLTDNPSYTSKADVGDSYVDRQSSPYICSVTGLEMNGRYKFCFLLGCGCAFSERAMKEVKSEVCHKCGRTFERDDVIILNGTDEEVEALRSRIEARRQRAKMEKKAKRKHKLEAAEGQAGSSKHTKSDTTTATKQTTSKSTNGKADGDKTKVEDEMTKLMRRQIQKDPKASAVYKSLFTTSEAALNQPKPHWITHNPQYY